MTEFGDTVGLHNQYHKNESNIVFHKNIGGSFLEAALYSLWVTDDQLFNTVARPLKTKFSKDEWIAWTQH